MKPCLKVSGFSSVSFSNQQQKIEIGKKRKERMSANTAAGNDSGAAPMVEKSVRSVFVGNIPYEATEEKLKEIFSSVGPVLSFKLVYDRENGKPRGYGFCEFMDPETALSAMRNINGTEIGGRALRVDSACTEKSRMEMQNLSGPQNPMTNPLLPPAMSSSSSFPGLPPQQETSIYGDAVDPDKAPESISKAVASLPPEQMFELMKQMKACIQNNPQEARNMLLQNPQLAYALLQAQVVMRIVDPEMALSMLHKAPPKPLLLGASGGPLPVPAPPHAFHPGSRTDFDRPPQQQQQEEPRFGRDPRNRDPRGDRAAGRAMRPDAAAAGSDSSMPPGLPPHMASADPDRTRLIMQVLQLTDAQIALLPRDQQNSIMELKKQINAPPK